MKFSPGTYRCNVTTGGQTSVTAQVTQGGNVLNMGTITYHWSDEDGMYVGDTVDATFDPEEDHTFEGATGTPPDVYIYGGEWVKL